ncbi:MAG: hypothetical protein HYX64_08090 [Gammaproteobacteria bacterium]|nr:hypothetical protein [Gammaproteobacteria bacterium]
MLKDLTPMFAYKLARLTMTWADAAKILFGAGLGLLISLGQAWLASERQRKRSEKLLLLELPTIQKIVEALAGKTLMPTTELPCLTYFGVNELASLSDSIAPHVYALDSALTRAEISRKVASGYVNNQSSPEFMVHSTVYTNCIDAAQKAIEAIQANLKGSNLTRKSMRVLRDKAAQLLNGFGK